MIRRRADVQVARLDLRQLVTASEVDETAIAARVKEITELEAAMLRERVNQMLALRRLLTPEQLEKLRGLSPMGRRPLRSGGPRGSGRRPGVESEGEDQGESESEALTRF